MGLTARRRHARSQNALLLLLTGRADAHACGLRLNDLCQPIKITMNNPGYGDFD